MARLLAAAAALLALSACAKTYEELAPFACPRSHLCPDDYVCGNGVCDLQEPCDPAATASGCGTPRSRCTVVAITETTFGGQCVKPVGGLGPAGSACALSYTNYEDASTVYVATGQFFGDDRSCGNGTICTSLEMKTQLIAGTNTAPGVCRAFCKSDAACAASEGCLDVFGKQAYPVSSQLGARVGVCFATCPFFGSTCGAGLSCGPALDLAAGAGLGVCHATGGGNGIGGQLHEGDSCSGYSACPSDLHCVAEGQGFHCRALCDATHACTGAGQACDTTTLKLAGGAGVCR